MPISSGTIKFISSLRQKKVRQNYHKFTAEGPRIVGELLRQARYPVDHVYALASWAEQSPPPAGVPLTVVSPKELGRISQLATPHQVLAVVDLPQGSTSAPAAPPPAFADHWSLYLDGIQSPSNLGALLRIADWFDFPYVFGGPGTADLYNSKSVQASMGSFLRVHYQEMDLTALVTAAPQLAVFGADLAGEDIYSVTPPPAGILVLGAEGPGIRAGTQVHINRRLTIPRAAGRQAESLNAAVAAGILCSALRRG
ncbi:23S rRNA (guanosine-2'-O-)-methyltransferase RlmB [Neolewinella maritima]|uniref:23S rRNA (Guanosine-2'-O-)-methyltransferase RlmB n=1 Tax=Neolewinella maritima TaxID=1383882 RepID=A0ABN8FA19_9BACT|nr:RNA methyltransferase [Neolewinella maritima]CAH1001405.1 23S rRNA (guanosine-2'-O-)-methyltransferase RlmB [Neolewinella maritima]